MSSIAEDPARRVGCPSRAGHGPCGRISARRCHSMTGPANGSRWTGAGWSTRPGAVSVQLEQTLEIHVPTRCVALDDVLL